MSEPAQYGHWDDRPGHPVEDWKYEVANDDTRQSYAEWCASREEFSVAKGDIVSVTIVDESRVERTDDSCRTCGQPYDHYGDGFDFECPDCADKSATMRGEVEP
jgi:predicted RNA-binding Zn-ribbon protein involved in translation (DUF1610 family)